LEEKGLEVSVTWRISDGRIQEFVVYATSSGVSVPIGLVMREGSSSSFLYARSWMERDGRYPVWQPTMPLKRGANSSIPVT
jgi:hypothetical protein